MLRGELIGLEVIIDKKTRGRIIDETKNMFVVRTKEMQKKYIKKSHEFEFIFQNKTVRVNGGLLVAKPEDRIKMRIK